MTIYKVTLMKGFQMKTIMKKYKMATVLAGLGLGVIACGGITIGGSLQVDKAFSLVDGKNAATAVAPGVYETKLKIDKKETELVFDIKLKTGDVSAKFKIPAGSSITKDSGKVVLKGSDNGQTFDLQAESSSRVQNTDTQQGEESCSYSAIVTGWHSETFCEDRGPSSEQERGPGHGEDRPGDRGPGHGEDRPGDRGPDHGPDHGKEQRPRCHVEQVYGPYQGTVYGTQSVSYYYSTVSDGTSAHVIDPASGAILGTFSSSSSDSEKIYTSRGSCN